MFGLSFSKLLVLAAVIAGVIFFFKMVTKLEKARRDVARGEMRACPTCGTYVPARGARDCGRELCPYGA